jgi:hypothetical protein
MGNTIPMKVFIDFAVLAIITPRQTREAPPMHTYLRPNKSESEPTKGQTAASARRFPRTLEIVNTGAEIIDWDSSTYKPNPSVDTSNITVDVRWDTTCLSLAKPWL